MVHKTCIVCGCDLGDVHGHTRYCFECNPRHQQFFQSKPSPIIQQTIIDALSLKEELTVPQLVEVTNIPAKTCFMYLDRLRREGRVNSFPKKVVPGRGRPRIYWYLKRGSPNAHNNQR